MRDEHSAKRSNQFHSLSHNDRYRTRGGAARGIVAFTGEKNTMPRGPLAQTF